MLATAIDLCEQLYNKDNITCSNNIFSPLACIFYEIYTSIFWKCQKSVLEFLVLIIQVKKIYFRYYYFDLCEKMHYAALRSKFDLQLFIQSVIESHNFLEMQKKKYCMITHIRFVKKYTLMLPVSILSFVKISA